MQQLAIKDAKNRPYKALWQLQRRGGTDIAKPGDNFQDTTMQNPQRCSVYAAVSKEEAERETWYSWSQLQGMTVVSHSSEMCASNRRIGETRPCDANAARQLVMSKEEEQTL